MSGEMGYLCAARCVNNCQHNLSCMQCMDTCLKKKKNTKKGSKQKALKPQAPAL